MSKIEVTLAPGSAGIRVVEQERVVPSLCKDGEGRVFVTIGAGETRVSILNADGARDASWTALFGWSFMFDIPVVVNGKEVRVDETELLQAALSGQARLFGTVCDTGAFAEVANLRMREALDQILSHTIGAGGQFTAIILAAPAWLHAALQGSLSVRPHVLQEISEI